MSPIRDLALIVRGSSDGALESTNAPALYAASFDLEGTVPKGMALQINTPTAFVGTSPTITVNVYASTSSAATSDSELVASMAILEAAAGNEYILPFTTPKRAIGVKLDLTGETTPTFGIVEVYVVENVGRGTGWSRLTDFH